MLDCELPNGSVRFSSRVAAVSVLPDSTPDNLLIEQAGNGDVSAFETLVRRYEDRLVHSLEHALGCREEALDAAQQAFVSAWRKLSSFRQDSAFYSWLYRIAMNAAISNKRRRRLRTTSLNSKSDTPGIIIADERDGADPQSRMDSAERIRLVRDALQQLTEEFRLPLVLKEIDGQSYEEIAAILEIPIGTVRSRIFRARREMTEYLQRMFRNDDR